MLKKKNTFFDFIDAAKFLILGLEENGMPLQASILKRI
jgi:protease II